MSGIVALFHLDGRPAEPATLERLVRPISHRAVDGLKLWFQGSSGVAHLHLQSTPTSCNEVQPAGCPQEMAISFDGRLDNREELISKLPGTSAQDLQNLSDAACVLAAYREFGESFAQHLKGDFAIALFDCAQQKLLLARDIMGICPLYHCQTQKTFLAASEIKSILAYPGFQTRPDDDALADLLLAGDPYERERTCFAGIFRVLPGHTVVVIPDKVRSFQHWDFDTTRQIRCGSIEEYAERLRALFEQAVRRRLRSSHPVAVMVSGGLDSSAILCQAELLKKAGASVAPCIGISMTFPEGTDADEKHFLADIESCHNVTIRKLVFGRLRFEDEEKYLWHAELPDLQWNSTLRMLDAAQEMDCRFVLDGYFGDQMLSGLGYLVDLARSFQWFQLRREFSELGRWMLEVDSAGLNRDLGLTLLRGLVPHKFVRTVRRYRGMPKSRHPAWYSESFRARAFQRYMNSNQRPRHYGSQHVRTCYEFLTARPRLNLVEGDNKRSAMRGLQMEYPFMDVDLVQFLMAIPGSIVNWTGAPKGLFRHSMKGILPEPIRQRRWKADFTALNNDAVARDYSKFQNYLRFNSLAVAGGYMDRVRVQREFVNPKLDVTDALPAVQASRAVALELWLRVFFRAEYLVSSDPEVC